MRRHAAVGRRVLIGGDTACRWRRRLGNRERVASRLRRKKATARGARSAVYAEGQKVGRGRDDPKPRRVHKIRGDTHGPVHRHVLRAGSARQSSREASEYVTPVRRGAHRHALATIVPPARSNGSRSRRIDGRRQQILRWRADDLRPHRGARRRGIAGPCQGAGCGVTDEIGLTGGEGQGHRSRVPFGGSDRVWSERRLHRGRHARD